MKNYTKEEKRKKNTLTHTHTHMEETLKHQNNNNNNYKQQDARIRELLLYRCGIFIHIAFAANLLTCVCWTDIEWRMHVYAMHSYQRKLYVMCTLAIVRCLFRISPRSQVLDIYCWSRVFCNALPPTYVLCTVLNRHKCNEFIKFKDIHAQSFLAWFDGLFMCSSIDKLTEHSQNAHSNSCKTLGSNVQPFVIYIHRQRSQLQL